MDLVLDLLIRIQNGYIAKRNNVSVLYSRRNLQILRLLVVNGFISSFNFTSNDELVVKLKYHYNDNIFKGLKILSKPGRRVYASVKKLHYGYSDKLLVVVSTTEGLMSHRYAIMRNLGGEILFELNAC